MRGGRISVHRPPLNLPTNLKSSPRSIFLSLCSSRQFPSLSLAYHPYHSPKFPLLVAIIPSPHSRGSRICRSVLV